MPVTTTQVLRRVPLFADLPEEALGAIAPVMREKRYNKGAVIVLRDEPGDALFVVTSGAVKVVLGAEDGREVILAVLGPGDFFGEMAVLDDERRSAHVIAMGEAELLVLRRDDFHAQLRSNPDLALALLREVSRRLRRANEQIARLVLLDVNGRVASLLLNLADQEDGQRITRRLTHHTIAQMIGTSRETVSRTLRHLEQRGVISVTRKEILLRDRATLVAASRRV